MENDYLLDTYELSDTEPNDNTLGLQSNQNVDNAAADLGIAEEVVVKKRKPAAKLDEHRLLGVNGIPALKAKIVPRMKFKGKGHAKRDLTKILSAYQIWAHGLFPKANFMDFVQLAKRAGSTPVMRVYRRQWIEVEKKKSTSDYLDEMYASRNQGSEDHGDNTIIPEAIDNYEQRASDIIPEEESLFFSDDGMPDASNLLSTGNITVQSDPSANQSREEEQFDEQDEIWSSIHHSNQSANKSPSNPTLSTSEAQESETKSPTEAPPTNENANSDSEDISDSEIIALTEMRPTSNLTTEENEEEGQEFDLFAGMDI
ncbi:Csm3p [Sugiyamaella lignohabitans]|uniref:Chromosome segregation in meiosis protein n=1 Tax=Sugiyamaella lignohabitans TaxID=796027 RepID=A0A167FGC5_9ASCO|nr:Csm3p [Sugiyamaella lignohabitans]ANB15265.1 Csm3p [Sugiyamaella lignohabitans]